MSHNDSILNILGIKDKNINIISVEEAEHNDDSVKEYITLITATLSYPINRCRNCGFPTVNKDGFPAFKRSLSDQYLQTLMTNTMGNTFYAKQFV